LRYYGKILFALWGQMDLVQLAEDYDRIIRASDLGLTLEASRHLELYKQTRFDLSLKRLLGPYQEAIINQRELSVDAISELAKQVVNAQFFCDGNHRTALLLCVHLMLLYNKTLPRIHTYLLYAAIDFEFLKCQQHLSETTATFFSGNAISTAIQSRSQVAMHSDKTANKWMQLRLDSVIGLPALIENLAHQFNNSTLSCTQKVQVKLFRQFSGFRPTMDHSSSLQIGTYVSSLEKKYLKNTAFNPRLDLYRPKHDASDERSSQESADHSSVRR